MFLASGHVIAMLSSRKKANAAACCLATIGQRAIPSISRNRSGSLVGSAHMYASQM